MASKVSLFLVELKRRKVYRVAVVYALAGAGIWAGAEVAFPALNLPPWCLTLVVVLTLIGFPIALVLAWAYELRPEEPSPDETLAEDSPPSPEPSERTTLTAIEKRKSIVVLPFDNMSPEASDVYFSDGLTEEITTHLSNLRSLRVISRSSAMVLKGTQKDVRAISRDLDVQYVLEGSVRKAGNALRITAQLIQAESDTHLWAESYDGVLEDIFGIQEQVSRSIVKALQLELGPQEDRHLAMRPIADLKAYDCYLKARYETWLFTEESLGRALDLLEKGQEMVGENDLLLSTKANINFNLVNALVRPPETFGRLLEDAEAWARRAIELNPASAQAYESLCLVCGGKGDTRGAVMNASKALEFDSDMGYALMIEGYFRAATGWDLVGSRRFLERLAKADPLNPINKGALGWLHWYEGDFKGMVEVWAEWQQQLETMRSPYMVMMAYFQAGAGNLDEAVRLVGLLEDALPDHTLTYLGTFLKHAWLGQKDQALGSVTPDLEEGARWDDIWPLYLAGGYALLDEKDRAFRWLDQAIGYGICNVSYLEEHDPFLSNLRSDQRFQDLMEKAGALRKTLTASLPTEGGI